MIRFFKKLANCTCQLVSISAIISDYARSRLKHDIHWTWVQIPPAPPLYLETSMKIYTKSGDEGTTSFYGGKRVLKNDIFVTTYGEVDELNSSIGVALSLLKATRINYPYSWWYKHFTKGKIRKTLIKQLEEIQNSLFNVGFELATPINHQNKIDKNELFKSFINEENITYLEKAIDKMEESLPPLENFILPTGVLPAAQLQLSRAICRRAERSIVTATQNVEISQNILVYINRLSDYLFVLARYTHHNFGIGPEKLWKK